MEGFFDQNLSPEDRIKAQFHLTPADPFFTVELEVGRILDEAGRYGLLVDRSILRSKIEATRDRLFVLQEEVNNLASRGVRVGSAADVAKLLFEELGLAPNWPSTPVSRVTRRPSLDKHSLSKYDHPIAKAISSWKSTRSTLSFLEKMETFIGEDSRVRTNFIPWTCATGRIYCRDLNLQQVHVPGREAIIPDPGMRFIYGDFSSVELKILYALAGEYDYYHDLMTSDIHSVVASRILHVPLESITEAHRKVAKVVSYGVAYGIYPSSLAFTLDITDDEARQYIDEFFETHPKIRQFLEVCKTEARVNGVARTIFGHVRDLSGENNIGTRERMGMNTPIQGACAGYLKQSIVSAHNRFLSDIPGSRFMMTVHDSILMQVPEDKEEQARILLEDCMHYVLPNPAPNGSHVEITAVIKAGKSWAEVAHGIPVEE